MTRALLIVTVLAALAACALKLNPSNPDRNAQEPFDSPVNEGRCRLMGLPDPLCKQKEQQRRH